ncbi:polysaccharide deacetylase family protein [Clostridium cylindrosporum]|uniref:Putative polysaccharide deacetylase YheN n=1 Tax=Clostridium cylindrosporum DSM 605 TaxID=1121307 RepID=A0A0J8D6F5_CLOCY|nr:polysaccharide deacetylase family protein [Clostridium cylindrosporum]KMT21670.1 putative polysaccharide deacetylase YheN [Clostridium cylindrosporum DSM 605]
MKIKKMIMLELILIVFLSLLFVSCGSGVKEVSTSNTVDGNAKDLPNKDVLLKEEKQVKKSYDKNQKVAFLTFDDGPSKNTEKILDILKKEDAKATFFVIGQDSDFAKSMYQRIVNEGHTIANHTYSHSYKNIYKSQEAFIQDVEKLNEYIYSITGVKTDVIRFPGGSNNHVNRKYSGSSDNGFMEGLGDRVETEGYAYFDWTVDSTDASKLRQSVERIVSATISESLRQKYPIVLFHDAPAKTTTVEALPQIIQELKKNGYKIDSLSKDSPVNSRFLKKEYGEILK